LRRADGARSAGYSPIGPPTVDANGAAYVAYEVRDIAYPPRITAATLYLMKIAPDGVAESLTLTSTTNDEDLFPGRIIPDGQGGVVVSWTVVSSTASNPSSTPRQPYKTLHVAADDTIGTPYDLPVTTRTVEYGTHPTLVLGRDAVAFVSDTVNPTDGPPVVAFNLNTGSIVWTYQALAGARVAILAATADGGVGLNDSQAGLLQVDASGTSATIAEAIDGTVGYTWTGEWFTQTSSGVGRVFLPLAVDSGNEWATPKGNASQNGAGAPLNGTLSAIAGINGRAALASAGETYLQVVGDPGLPPHNLGQLFNLAASTEKNALTGAGHTVFTDRISSVQDFATSLTSHGTITGGVIYYGHAGQSPDYSRSLLAPGERSGVDTNVSEGNVHLLSNAQLATGAVITLKGCHAGLQPVWNARGHSIAQLIANQ
jgi:hypothetical protein